MILTGFVWLRIGLGSGFCEHGNGLSGAVKWLGILLSFRGTVGFS
jgi:hypothetical protein